MGFTVQRFHPLIRPGLYLGADGSAIPVFSRQSAWDSLCTLHALASALKILGLIADPARIATRQRKIEAAIWRKATDIFQTGVTFTELADFIAGLDCGLRIKLFERGSHREVIPFIERELARKRLVIASFRVIGESHNHAALVIGVEGLEHGGRFVPHALLILDPAESPPGAFATGNARLDYADRKPGKARRLWRYSKYATAGETFSVVVNAALSIHVDKPLRPSQLSAR
ncbi:MAG: hypothetical protein V4793_25930 [Paraburkholderia tropica]|uniref:hypothetical protein n=1 Tax=Paraburkholderia tropica TaxID=92647 RepID=UPI001F19526B|nr:hypothetical protein [Paraburkholderia tropica]MDE1142908.1 hypothetical protein [Paraburkholderia tropica]